MYRYHYSLDIQMEEYTGKQEDKLVGQFEGIYADEDGETITDKMIAFNIKI